MSAVEEIGQAIATLERLKADSTPGPWENLGGLIESDHEPYEVTPREVECMSYCYGGSVKRMSNADADLIVILRSTLDPMLAILRHDVKIHAAFKHTGQEHRWLDAVSRAGDLDLARAINRATS